MSTGYISTYPSSGYASETQIRNEFQKLQTALEDTVSRSNTGTGPNEMEVDLDIGGKTIFNVQDIMLGGDSIYDIITDISKGFADAAEQSALESANSAAAALVSENNAATSESNAATSESNAAHSEQAASNYAGDAHETLEDFKGRYYGPSIVEPTTRPDGSAIQLGDLYYDLSSDKILVWSQDGDLVPFWTFAGTGPQGIQGIQGVEGPQGPRGQEGQQGIQGIQGPTGAQGVQGEQGLQGELGPVGPMGPAGPQGVQGVVGPIGIQGVQGPKGDVGETGQRGPQGHEGPQGLTGPIGLQGPQGVQGQQGDRGEDGDNFNISEFGTLIERDQYDDAPRGFVYYASDVQSIVDRDPVYFNFSYDPSNRYYVPEYVPGQQSVIVSVNNILQTPESYSLDIVVDEDTQEHNYYLNLVAQPGDVIQLRSITNSTSFGTIFFKLSSAHKDWGPAIPFGRGPQGFRGDSGIAGPQGIQGERGPQGPQGDQGIDGAEGAIGQQGPRGEKGEQGDQGPVGIVGPQGSIGETGPRGPVGPQGLVGPRGLEGPQGIEGPQGEPGVRGEDGDQGLPGQQGTQGAPAELTAPADNTNVWGIRNNEWVSILGPLASANRLVSAETSINAGTGLVGGGNLTASRGISIGPSVVNATAEFLGGGANLNGYTRPGVYYQDYNANTSLALNYPVAQAGSLEVFTAAGIIQVYRVYNSGRSFQRSQYSTADWTAWVERASKADIVKITYGTTAGTAAQGNDSRITGAVQQSTFTATLSDLKLALGQGATASGLRSTALGEGATASGLRSIALGSVAKASANYDVALGYDARASGGSSTALGYFAIASGNVSAALGNSSNASGFASTALGWGSKSVGTHSTALGSQAATTGNSQIQIGAQSGDSKPSNIYVSKSVQVRSDERDKSAIRDTELGLNFITKLRPIKFLYDYRQDYMEPRPEGFFDLPKEEQEAWENERARLLNNNLVEKDGAHKSKRFQDGFSAQQVKEVIDELGIDFSGYIDESINGGSKYDTKSLAHDKFIAPIVKAIQEQQQMIEDLQERLKRLEAKDS